MTQSCKFTPIVLLALFATAISGCAYMPQPRESFEPPDPISVTHAPPTDGAIYRANTDVRLFEDLKASRVGDILTVRLDEQTNASKASQTSTSKSTEAELANPVALGRPFTYKGDPIFGGSLAGENTFDGSGASSQSNSLVGDITVTVVERLANGNLRIRGEKWVTLNQGREFIQLSGTIRPNDIETDNTLLSTRIANAQITYSSKGVLAAANKMGFVSRFFNSVLNPY